MNPGNIWHIMNPIRVWRLPGKRMREKAYAAGVVRTSVNNALTTDILSVLKNQRLKLTLGSVNIFL
jgi:hypothetical protein